MPPSAPGQVVEAGSQCGETLAKLPYVFRILRPPNVPMISARLTGVNRRAILDYIIQGIMKKSYGNLREKDTSYIRTILQRSGSKNKVFPVGGQ